MVSSVFSGSSYFNLFIMPMVLEIVFAILVICCFQFRCLFSISPKYILIFVNLRFKFV